MVSIVDDSFDNVHLEPDISVQTRNLGSMNLLMSDLEMLTAAAANQDDNSSSTITENS